MNIFYLDHNPETAARYHCNQHVPKMIVETAQMLSNAHWRTGYSGANHVEHGRGPYRQCRKAGPTLGPMVWIMESLVNYRWAVRLGLALCAEFERRFSGRPHKTSEVLAWLRDHEPELPDVGPTSFIAAHMGKYSVPGDPVESYRRYYIGEKYWFANWPDGETPNWFARGVNGTYPADRSTAVAS